MKKSGPKANTARAATKAAKPRARTRTSSGGTPAKPGSGASPTLVPIGARLRHARLVKGWLIKELAERVGVSVSLISKYENDKLLPPLTVLHSLVSELETNIGALFEANWSSLTYVARQGSRPCLAAGGKAEAAGVTLERLIPNGRGHLLQGNIHIVPPGGGSMGSIRHEGDEFGYVLEGRLELRIEETAHDLAPGDSFAFPSNLPHTYRNPGKAVTRVLWINTPPTF